MGTRRAVLPAIIAGIALVAGPAHAQSSAAVEVVDSAFVPAEVTVDQGGTVTWTQTGMLPHSVTADDGSFDSHPNCGDGDCMGTGDTFVHTFDEPGTHAYYCRVHGAPGGVGMSGTVVVTAAAAEEPTTAPTEPAPTEPAPTEAQTTTPTEEETTAPDATDAATVEVTATDAGAEAEELAETGTPALALLATAALLVLAGVAANRRGGVED